MSEKTQPISRRNVLKAGVAASAGLFALSTSRLFAAEKAAGEESVRCMVYVPHWDFDEPTKTAFGDVVGHALAEAMALDAVLQENMRGIDLSNDAEARGFDVRTLMEGCITALALPEKLLKRLGPCLLVSFPSEASESQAKNRGVKQVAKKLKEIAKDILRPDSAPPAQASQAPPSGCIFVNVNVNNNLKHRGLGKELKKAWNKVGKKALKAAGKALVDEAIGKIPGAATAKTLISRGPALETLDSKRRGFELPDDVPVTFSEPVVLMW